MKVHVDVLLATFNGADYLAEMLGSLAQQEDVIINLIASDDGSTDGTLEILESFRQNFNSMQILSGPGTGPANNFVSMLSRTTSPFIAFADQDDIWVSNHLRNSARRLGLERSEEPSLTFSQVSHFGETISAEVNWPKSIPKHFSGFFAQNFAQGCTIVFNRSMKETLESHIINEMIMHDWWAVLVALGSGNVIFEPSVEVFYRIHSNNHVGVKGKSRFAFLNYPKPRVWAPLNQIREIRMVGTNYFSEDFLICCDKFLSGISGKFPTRFRFAFGYKHRLRQSKIDEVILRLGILAYPLIFDS
jgi:glycosyltransferase involved in cell wall biosynthesis